MKIQLLGHDVAWKYSSTPTNFTTTSNTELSKPNLTASSLTLKCYSQPRFDEAVKLLLLFHKFRVSRSPDSGSLPVGEHECLWPRRSCVKNGSFPGQKSLHWPCRRTNLRP